MKAYICLQCGAPLDTTKGKCQYCGVSWRPEETRPMLISPLDLTSSSATYYAPNLIYASMTVGGWNPPPEEDDPEDWDTDDWEEP